MVIHFEVRLWLSVTAIGKKVGGSVKGLLEERIKS